MKRLSVVGVLVLLAVVAGSCSRGGGDEELARVDGTTLTSSEFYASVPEQLLAVMSVEDQEEALRTWVKTELFYQEGVRRGVDDREDMRRRIRELERELVAEEYIKEFIEGVPEVTEEEARAYFDEHESEYSMQVRLAHILVRSRPEAERALEQINDGTPFETVASAMSIDQTASIGGDLGYMRRGEILHELEEPAFSLKVGETSAVIPSSYGYHIIKVLDRQPGAGRPTFDARRGAVMNFLTSHRRREAFDRRLDELASHATVIVDTAALRAAVRQRMSETATEDASGRTDEGPAADEEGSP